MKGPSLQYEVRVLRVFRCSACGRQVQLPGRVTTSVCHCSDPPKFMQPIDRAKTVPPDMSAFVSPPDPEDLIEEPVDEEPYVPFIPQLPPRVERFPNRHKLTDDIDKFQPPAEFADGVATGGETENREAEGGPPSNTGREGNRQRHRGPQRPRGQSSQQGQQRQSGQTPQSNQPRRPDRGNRDGHRSQRRDVPPRDAGPATNLPAIVDNSDFGDTVFDEADSDLPLDGSASEPEGTDSPGSRPRRRGRRRGRGRRPSGGADNG